jgi:plasmid stability protein
MTITINIPDEQAAVLQAKAAAHGLTLEEWLARLATQEETPDPILSAQSAVARILEIQKSVKPDPEGLTIRDYINLNRP